MIIEDERLAPYRIKCDGIQFTVEYLTDPGKAPSHIQKSSSAGQWQVKSYHSDIVHAVRWIGNKQLQATAGQVDLDDVIKILDSIYRDMAQAVQEFHLSSLALRRIHENPKAGV